MSNALQPTGLILPGKVAQTPVVDLLPYRDDASAGSITQNSLYFYRVVPLASFQTTKAQIYVGAANGNFDLAVGTISGTTFTRETALGSTAVAGASAAQEVNLTINWVRGRAVYVCVGFDGTATVQRISPLLVTIPALGGRAFSKASGWSSGIPASVASLAASVDRIVKVVFF